MSFNPHKYQQMSHTTLNRKKNHNNNNIKKTLPNLKCSELLKLKNSIPVQTSLIFYIL